MSDARNKVNHLLKFWVLCSNLEKYAEHSKAIRIASCLSTVSILAAVPVHQMKLGGVGLTIHRVFGSLIAGGTPVAMELLQPVRTSERTADQFRSFPVDVDSPAVASVDNHACVLGDVFPPEGLRLQRRVRNRN